MWEVHYSDGSFITSEDCTPENIRQRDDVQVIIQNDSDHRWKTVTGHDYYMWDTRYGKPQWFGGDREGFETYLRKPGWKCVLFGYHIDKRQYWKVLESARKRHGEKTGYNAGERLP